MPMELDVKGVAELVNRISKFDQDVYKILTKEVREGLTPIAQHARSNTPDQPLSNWGSWTETTGQSGQVGVVTMVTGTRDRSFSGASVRKGIKPQAIKRSKRGQVTKFSGRVVTMSPAGAIFAMAGSRTGGTFENNLIRRWGRTWPRTLTDALYAEGPKAREAIEDAIDKAAEAVNGRRV
jgi:hypothetical protein